MSDTREHRSSGSAAGGGRGAVACFAPAAAVALDDLEAIVWQRVDATLLDLASRVVGATHGIPPLPRPSNLGPSRWAGRDAAAWRTFADLDERQRGALAFVEQFTLDVSSVDDALRTRLFHALGNEAAEFAQAIYVADVMPRARAVLDRLFGESAAADPRTTSDLKADVTVWNGIDALIRVVPRLQGLDAVVTELVRLRGARQHQCRFCKSIRSRAAMVAGADDATFAAVDHYPTSDLPDAMKAALALTDAFIWTPGRLADEAIAGIRRHFTPARQVELVLDVARNASNKFAVAMAADATHVIEGYDIYDVKPDGTIEFGLAPP